MTQVELVERIQGQITGIYARIPHTGKFLTRCFTKLSQDVMELKVSIELVQDTIRIALNTAGYDVDSMNQFERASAILDMAQEYASILPINAEEIWEYDNKEQTMGA